MKKRHKLLIIAIIFLSFVLRFYKLDSFPPALYNDEISNGYNAYSILKTGKDEYGVHFPALFRSFDDYKPGFYIYSIVPFIYAFGLNEIAVRIPSALAGTLTVLILFLITKKLFKNNAIAYSAAFFLAISPWHIHFSRGGFESNLMVFLTLTAFYFFLHSVKKTRYLLIATFLFGLSLNTYQAAKIWTPLIIIAIVFWYRSEIVNFGKKLIAPILILLFFALPMLVDFENSLLRGRSVSIFANSKEPVAEFISNYFSHYSPTFLFFSGDQIGRHSVSGIGELFVFQIPLIVLGLFFLLKSNLRESKFLLCLLLISPIPASLSAPSPHALRALTLAPIWSIISAFGVYVIIRTNILSVLRRIVALIITVIMIYNTLLYLHLYYVHYSKEKFPDWQYGYKEMISYVKEVEGTYNTIAISNFHGHSYIFTLFHLKYDPAKYHSLNGNYEKFDKFEFFGSQWSKSRPGKALVVTPAWQSHPPSILKEIYAPNGDLVFRISETE